MRCRRKFHRKGDPSARQEAENSMVFSSAEFLFLYFPIALLIYFICPRKVRNIWLLVISLVFYGWGEAKLVFLMVFTIIIDYIFGYLVDRYRENKKRSKLFLILAVVVNLTILGFFKYYDFICGTLNHIPGVNLPLLGLPLPIGISFYTFQALSYVIDVYRDDAKVQKNIASFGTYVTLFPQLIAGPIVRYKDIDRQLRDRTERVSLFASGVRTFVCGLGKKMILANVVGQIWETYRAVPLDQRTVVGSWIGIIAFSFQLYFDFSAYSDMAIGIGKMFGFTFLENFNYPYIAASITEFWRRWHISLSTWFRDNVYFPLGGSRKGKFKTYRNLLIVWLLTGIWHGASWNFVLWGVYYGVILMLEKGFLLKALEKVPSAVRHFYTLFLVLFGWLLFAFDDMGAGFVYLGNMFGAGSSAFVSQADIYCLIRNLLFFIILGIASTPLPKKLFYRLYFASKRFRYAVPVGTLLLLTVSTALVVNSGFNPFLYFRF